MRFLFERPLAWSDELIVILYILIVFWSAATLLQEKDHVMLDLVYAALPPGGQRVFGARRRRTDGADCCWCCLPEAFDYVRFMGREKTPVLDIPFSSCSHHSCCSSLLVAWRYVVKFVRLLGPGWKREL